MTEVLVFLAGSLSLELRMDPLSAPNKQAVSGPAQWPCGRALHCHTGYKC